MKMTNQLPKISGLKQIGLVSIIAVLVVLLPGCAVKRPLLSTGIVDEVALIATTANFRLPTGISGPAGVARAQFKNRSAEINSVMLNYIDTLHLAVAHNLKTQLGCKVLFGESLHALPQYQDVKKKYEKPDALNKEDEKFPEILISSGDFNFDIAETNCGLMSGGGIVLVEPIELKEIIRNLCQELNVKHIAVAKFVFTGFRADIIFPTDTYLNYSLSLYNQDGDCLATSSGFEKTVKMLENNLSESYRNMVAAYLNKSELIELRSVFDKK